MSDQLNITMADRAEAEHPVSIASQDSDPPKDQEKKKSKKPASKTPAIGFDFLPVIQDRRDSGANQRYRHGVQTTAVEGMAVGFLAARVDHHTELGIPAEGGH